MVCADTRKSPHTPLLMILGLAAVLGTGPSAWGACSCTGMTISHSNSQKVTICSNEALTFNECRRAPGSNSNGCAGSTYAYTCPVGVTSESLLSQKTGFAVSATLKGTASECRSGQALQLTIKSDFGVSKPKVLETPSGQITVGGFAALVTNDRRRIYPDVGDRSEGYPFFGADSYTNPKASDLLIHETANGIQWWWDNTDQTKDKDTENASWHYRFYSFVQGSAPKDGCACVFDIEVNWPAKLRPRTNYTKVGAVSTHCNF